MSGGNGAVAGGAVGVSCARADVASPTVVRQTKTARSRGIREDRAGRPDPRCMAAQQRHRYNTSDTLRVCAAASAPSIRATRIVSHQTILILDFGSQFTQLIARRLRELSVYCEILPFHTPPETLAARKPVGIILSGGPKSVSEDGAPKCDVDVLTLGMPVLGICYGMQLMTDLLGGRVAPASHREFGHATVHVTSPSARLLGDLPHDLRVWASHGDYVEAAPPGFTVVATSANAPVAAMEAPDRRLYGLLFHPEVAHTDRGLEILRHFAFDVCGCTGDWTMASFVDEATARIRQQVGDGARGLRPERRRRFDGGGGADSSRHRRSADLHLRGQRRPASGRGRPGADALPRQAETAARVRGCVRRVPDGSRRRDGSGAQAEDHRRHVHRRLREEGRRARLLRLPRTGHPLSRRHRIGLRRRAVRRRSRATTTSAACRTGCGSSSSSRCASSSRTRCAASGATSAWTRSSWSASPSRARASPCASSARSPRYGWICCAAPTPSSWTK